MSVEAQATAYQNGRRLFARGSPVYFSAFAVVQVPWVAAPLEACGWGSRRIHV